MGKTSIEWTDHSWPVVNGCRRISAGCTNCYAERLTATRLSQTPKYQGLARFGENGPRWTGEVRLWEPHLDMPFKLRKPSRIFVCDMGDLFFEEVPDGVIAAVFGVMAACPQHTFQVLTKRPARAREWFKWVAADDGRWITGGSGQERSRVFSFAEGATEVNWPTLAQRFQDLGIAEGYDGHSLIQPKDEGPWPLPNVWLGVSVEDQATADERIPILLDIPAALRFVSAEPLLGPIDLRPWLMSPAPELFEDDPMAGFLMAQAIGEGLGDCRRGLGWVIVGGESGPGARPCAVEWIEGVVEQCAAAGAAAFVKQLGAKVVSTGRVDLEGRWVWQAGLKDRKGGDPAEWPDQLRVRQFPTPPPSNLPEKSEAALPARGKNPADLGGGDTGGIKKGVAADRVSSAPPTTTMDDIRVALAPGKPLNRGELAQATGRTEKAVASCLTKLRALGAAVVEDGYWTLAAGADDGTGLESAATPSG